MPAPVAAAAGDQLLPRQAAALLGQAGERVIFRQQADDGPPAAVGGGEGGGDVADAPLHFEALLLQHSAVQVGRLLLLERQLRKGPDLICHLGYQICFFFDGGDGRLLFCCHGDAPFCAGCPGPLKRARTDVRAPQLPGPAAQRAALGSGCLTVPC